VTGFADWYDTAAIGAWAGQTASLVESVLRSLAYTIDAYFASITGQILGRWVRPSGPIDVSGLRAGITPAGVYGRVADAYRFQQAQIDKAATPRWTAPSRSPTCPPSSSRAIRHGRR
jgi:hypothetical protein